MNPAALEGILAILCDRRQHCRDLLDLSRQQQRLIESSDYSALLTILGQKQRILGRLDEVKSRHPDLIQSWHAVRDRCDPDIRRDCDAVIAETENILAELLTTENEGAEILGRYRDATRRQLEGIAQGVRVHDAYRDNLAPVNHRHFDAGR